MNGIASIIVDNNPLASVSPETYRRTFLRGEWRGYQHELRAIGGFWNASFVLQEDQVNIERWMETGLGRRVRTTLPDGRIAWEGYVNTLRLEKGGVTYEISLDNMANRVWVVYVSTAPSQEVGSTLQINDPEALARLLLFGETNKTRSTTYNNTVSQGKYGIKEIVLSGGEMSATIANQAAQAYLALSLDPIRGLMQVQRGSQKGKQTTLTVQCQGYMRTLGWRTYNHTGGATAQVSALIGTIITAAGPYIASTSIDANTSAVPEDYNSDRYAESILLDLARLGDSSFNRYTLGVWEDRKLIYKQAASGSLDNVGYRTRRDGAIEDAQGRKVNPAEIRPDRWLREGNIFASRIRHPATLYEDPSVAFLEAVTFREPNQLTLIGSRGNQLDSVLSRISLAGNAAI